MPFLVRAGGGIVASQAELSWWPEQKVAVIPAAFLAAGFGPGHILYPASGAALRPPARSQFRGVAMECPGSREFGTHGMA